MILGFDSFGYNDGVAFSTTTALNNFNKLELSNCIADQLTVGSDITKDFSTTKDNWGITTILNALFDGSLSAGNIDNNGTPITQLKLMKRETNTLIWQDIALFDFNNNIRIYEYTDRIISSATNYEYALVPMSADVMGNSIVASITSDFDGTWICNRDNGYKLFYNLNYQDIENVCPANVIETFNRYPTIIYSPLDYKKSSIKCQILTENSLYGKIDVQAEKENRNNILNFLKSKKPFIFKNSAGDFMMVSISSPKESRNNSLAQSIMEISFDWIECGGTDNKSLKNAGLCL